MDANDQSSTCSSPHVSLNPSIEQSNKRQRRQSSSVWLHFIKLAPDVNGTTKAKCKWCSQEYVASSSVGTSNMKRHIPNCSGLKGQNVQTKPIFDEAFFREKLTVALVKHNLPFSFVEYEGMRDLFHYLNPDVATISRNTAKADVWKLHEREKCALRHALKSVSGRICLTSDLWSSITTDGYLALTAHYVDENWILQKRVLNFRHIPPPHTGPILAAYIIDLLREYGIEKKIFTITLDNAKYNDGLVDAMLRHFNLIGSSISRGDFFHIRCGAHILNLIVHAGLEIIDEHVTKIRECVKYVRASEARKMKFARCIAQVSLSCSKKVSQDIPTRWNSTFLMLDNALHFRLAFEQLKNVDSNFKLCPSEEEWSMVRQIARFLKPFFDITTLFSGTEYPTSNLYFHGVWKIEQLINQEMHNQCEKFREMAIKMKRKFDKYWDCYSVILSFALILDPRFKLEYVKFCFNKIYTDVISEERVSNIRQRFKLLFDEYFNQSSVTSLSTSPGDSSCRNFSIGMDDEIDEVDEFENQHHALSRNRSEFELYLSDTRLPGKQELNVLKFWKDNSNRYPTLSMMAKDILSIPITTVASESTFSIGGRIIGKYRSSLLPDTAEALLCTRDWLFGVEASQSSTEDTELTIDFAPLVAQLDIHEVI